MHAQNGLFAGFCIMLVLVLAACGGSGPTVSAARPVITSQPSAAAPQLGDSASFTIHATGNSLTYQWYKDGTELSGATLSTLTIDPVTADDAGEYYVVITNPYGTATSNTVELTITPGDAPAITTQPSALIVAEGDPASFSVVATGIDLTYQWYKDDAAIDGATDADYSIDAVVADDAGTYYVVVSNTEGDATSDGALLTVTTGAIDGTYEQSGGDFTYSDKNYFTNENDTNAVQLSQDGVLHLSSSNVGNAGDSSDEEQSSFEGLNAAVLAEGNSMLYLTDCEITTSGGFANGLFATGSETEATMSGGSIVTIKDGGHGVDATYGAKITLSGVNISTSGDSAAAAIATDQGGGTVYVTGGTITTAGTTSPTIYSTGDITVYDAELTATGCEGVTIEGGNSIILNNCVLIGATDGAKFHRTTADAATAIGMLTLNGGSLTAQDGDAFLVLGTNNENATINVRGGAVLSMTGYIVDALDGTTVNFTALTTDLTGDFFADGDSTLTVSLGDGSTLVGVLTNAGLSLDAGCSWTLTANCALTTFDDASGISGSSISNVHGNGHTVTYDATLAANSGLEGKSYSLSGGGFLVPAG